MAIMECLIPFNIPCRRINVRAISINKKAMLCKPDNRKLCQDVWDNMCILFIVSISILDMFMNDIKSGSFAFSASENFDIWEISENKILYPDAKPIPKAMPSILLVCSFKKNFNPKNLPPSSKMIAVKTINAI